MSEQRDDERLDEPPADEPEAVEGGNELGFRNVSEEEAYDEAGTQGDDGDVTRR